MIESIRSGGAGTRQTLARMARLAEEGAHLFDGWLVGGDLDTYLRDRWRFVPEDVETLRTPAHQLRWYRTYAEFVGDCDDAAILAAAICLALKPHGFCSLVRFVAVRPPEFSEFSHVFMEYFDPSVPDGEIWRRVDPTADRQNAYEGWERMEYIL